MNNCTSLKYYEHSEFMKSSKEDLLNRLKTNAVIDDGLLKTILRNILSNDEVKIKDYYSGLMIYLHYFTKKLTFNEFSSCLEEQLNEENPLGMILIYGALVKSNCILSWTCEDQHKVLCKLLHYGKMQSSLQFIVFDYLNSFVTNCKTDSFMAESILSKKKILSKTSTCFQFYFFLYVERKFSGNSDDESEILKNTSPDMLSQIILNNCEGFSLFNELSHLLIKPLMSDIPCFVTFWESLISQYHESPNSSNSAKIVILVSGILRHLSSDNYSYLEKLFSPDLFVIFHNTASSSLINDIFSLFSKALKGSTDETKLVLFNTMLTSCKKFSNKSNIHGFIEQIVSSLNSDGVITVAKIYLKIINGQMNKMLNPEIIKFSDKEKAYFVNLYGRILNHSVSQKDVKFRKKGVQQLFSIGFLAEHSEVISSEVASAARKVFFTCLLQRYSKLIDFINILDSVVSTVTMKMSDVSNFVVPINSQIKKHWDVALKLLKSIQDDSITDNLVVFQVVTLYMMLYLFKSEKIASETIKEVSNVLKHAREKNTHNIHWTEVMVDVFLHLLSMPQESHTQFICCVFGTICKIMTPKALKLILTAVNPMHDDDDDALDEESGSEVEDSESGSDDDENNSVLDDSNSDEEETPNEKLRMALREELFKMDTASTCGSIDLDNLDEEEGTRLNISLSQVFKQQLKGKSKIDIATIDFKIRALNLLSTFVEHQPPVETIFVIASKLIKYLKCSIGVKDLQIYSGSLKKCFKTIIGSVKITDCKECSTDFLISTFDSIISCDCPKSIYQEISPEVADCCLLIVKLLYSTDNFKDIVKKLNEVIDSYFSHHDTYYSHHLITSVIVSSSPIVPYLLPTIVDYAFSGNLKVSRKHKAIELLCKFFTNKRFYVTDSPKLNKKISNSINKIIENSISFLKECRDNTFSSKCLAVLFKLLILISKILNQGEKNPAILSQLADALKSQYENILPRFVGNKVKKAFKRLCTVYSVIPQIVPSKRKLKALKRANRSYKKESNTKENGEVKDEPTPKKKKKRSVS